MTSKEAARDIRALSSGTIGLLTGLRDYEEIDEVRERVALAIRQEPVEFKSWATAWTEVYGPTAKGSLA